ncbi:MAG: isoamylase [Treponema sp.]|nr:isoamylase [Treponema sp.]
MKNITAVFLLILFIGTIGAADLESSILIDCLLSLPGPEAPLILEDSIIFTAPSSYRRAGISFAHEGYSKVHWFQIFMIPEDPAIIAAAKKKDAPLFRESGILFHVQPFSGSMKNLDYRMVIDGLWTPDPLNPLVITNAGGLSFSRVVLPDRPGIPPVQEQSAAQSASSGILFSYNAPPGETVTIGGSFNRWDPFMYELQETSPGLYCINLFLPPGTYQYVFFHRGERFADTNNSRKVYSLDGKTVSEVVVR